MYFIESETPIKGATCIRKEPVNTKPATGLEQEACKKGKEKALEQLVETRVSSFATDTQAYFNLLKTMLDYARSAKKYEESLGITADDQERILGKEGVEVLSGIVLKSRKA